MSQALNQPVSVSLLQPSKYTITFARMPSIQYFCQKVNVPGFSYPNTDQATPFINRKIPGNKIEYSTLDIEWTLEETLQSWLEIWQWGRDLADTKSFTEYANLPRLSSTLNGVPFPQYSDCILTINSTQNNPKLMIRFRDCFPINLSDIQMDTTTSDDNPIVSNASFAYFYPEILQTTL